MLIPSMVLTAQLGCLHWFGPSHHLTISKPTALFARQAALLDSLYGTERGLSARSETRAEINELISQIEAKNPTPDPTEVHACQRGCLLTRDMRAVFPADIKQLPVVLGC